MHVGLFLCQRGRCFLGSCLRLGIFLVCVSGARTVVAVIGAATGTFFALVVGDGMVGACVGTFALDPGRAFAFALALALVSGVVEASMLWNQNLNSYRSIDVIEYVSEHAWSWGSGSPKCGGAHTYVRVCPRSVSGLANLCSYFRSYLLEQLNSSLFFVNRRASC